MCQFNLNVTLLTFYFVFLYLDNSNPVLRGVAFGAIGFSALIAITLTIATISVYIYFRTRTRK